MKRVASVRAPTIIRKCAALLAALVFAPTVATAAPTRVDALLSASGRALGVTALPRVRAVVLSGGVMVAGVHGRAIQWQDVMSGASAQSFDAGPLSGASGWDGVHEWNRDRGGFVWDDASMSAVALARENALVAGYGLWSAGRGGALVEDAGSRMLDGRKIDVVCVTPRSQEPHTFELSLDARTHLPVRAVGTFGGTTTTQTFGSWHNINGLQVAFAQKSSTEQGAVELTYTRGSTIAARLLNPRLQRPRTHIIDTAIDAPAVTVPFELVDHHVALDVMIDGKGPFHFLFDSGGQNAIDSDVAKQLNLQPAGQVAGSGVGAELENVAFAQVRSLVIGGVLVRDQAFVVLPIRAGFGAGGGAPIDGLIGFEVLARLQTTFDYAQRTVTFRTPSASLPVGASLPFVFDGNIPRIACSIGGIPGACTLDTGARNAVTIRAPFAAAHPEVLPANATAVGANGFGLGGASMGKLGRTTLGIGGFIIPDVIADFSVQQAGAFADPSSAANIGGATLKRFTLTFDYQRSALVLAPNAAFSDRETYDRSGLFILARKGAAVVSNVRLGTPAADAGIVAGDTIEAINGMPILELSGLRAILSGPTETSVGLTLRRKNASTYEATFVLRDYI